MLHAEAESGEKGGMNAKIANVREEVLRSNVSVNSRSHNKLRDVADKCLCKTNLTPHRSTFRTPNLTRFAVFASLLWVIVAPLAVPKLSAARICARLCEVERKETNAHYVDDYRIARLTIRYADEGYPDPWGYAFWMYLGIHPAKFPAALEARRRAQLGELYGAFWGGDGKAGAASSSWAHTPASSPKKPAQAEKKLRRAA